jgi:hypothetical protein
MTINELTAYIHAHTDNFERVHIRFEPLEWTSKQLNEAWEQVLEVLPLLQLGLEDPANHRAEALVLTLLSQGALIHGYTPKKEKS